MTSKVMIEDEGNSILPIILEGISGIILLCYSFYFLIEGYKEVVSIFTCLLWMVGTIILWYLGCWLCLWFIRDYREREREREE